GVPAEEIAHHPVDGGISQKEAVGFLTAQPFAQKVIGLFKVVVVELGEPGSDQHPLERVIVTPSADLGESFPQEIDRGFVMTAISFKGPQELLVTGQLERVASSLGLELSQGFRKGRTGSGRLPQNPQEVPALHQRSAT